MNLLLVEVDGAGLSLLRELCRDTDHRLLCCRSAREAVESCRWHAGRIDGIVINGGPGGANRDLERWLRGAGCRAPVVYLASGEPVPLEVTAVAWGTEQGTAAPPLEVSRRSLTRLDLFRLLSRLGGEYERQEMIFEYHAPHPVQKPTTDRRQRCLQPESENL